MWGKEGKRRPEENKPCSLELEMLKQELRPGFLSGRIVFLSRLPAGPR